MFAQRLVETELADQRLLLFGGRGVVDERGQGGAGHGAEHEEQDGRDHPEDEDHLSEPL